MKKFTLLAVMAITFLMVSCSEDVKESKAETAKKKEIKKEVVKDYDYYLKRIGEDEKWMASLKVKAEESGMTVEESLIKSAKHMAKQNGFEVIIDKSQEKLDKQIQVIKNNKEWLESTKNKAEERNISLDSMLIRTAKYVISERELKK
jgi:predicted DNA-binding protein (MmcQ/YjbR family)